MSGILSLTCCGGDDRLAIQAFGSITGRGARNDADQVWVGFCIQAAFDGKNTEVRWTAVSDGKGLGN